MKRTLITAALLAAIPVCYGQATSSGTTVPSVGVTSPTPGTGTVQQQPGSGVITTTPGPMTGSTGAAPLGPGGASVGQTIQGTPSPSTPSSLGGTTLQPGVLGSAPPSPGVIGTPAPASPCIGTVGMSGCAPTQ